MCERIIVNATLPLKPKAWERTEGKAVRYMPKSQRDYYYALYAEMFTAGMRPLAKGKEYGIEIRFYRKDHRLLDCDNVLKAFLDAGQPSNWVNPKIDVGYVDLWNDKVFGETHTYRNYGAAEDKIRVLIWRLN